MLSANVSSVLAHCRVDEHAPDETRRSPRRRENSIKANRSNCAARNLPEGRERSDGVASRRVDNRHKYGVSEQVKAAKREVSSDRVELPLVRDPGNGDFYRNVHDFRTK